MSSFSSYPSMLEIIRNPGLLFWNPTNLSAEATWGTKLGYTEKGVAFDPGYNYGMLTGEEKGDEPIARVFLGASPSIITVIKNYNTTMLQVLFPGMIISNFLHIPGNILPGTDLFGASYTAPLLYVPDDVVNHPCILFQKASPNIIATSKILCSHHSNSSYPVVFTAARDTNDSNGIAYYGPLSGAVLR